MVGDRIVLDEPLSGEAERVRAETLAWWQEVAATRLNSTMAPVIIMARLHEQDIHSPAVTITWPSSDMLTLP